MRHKFVLRLPLRENMEKRAAGLIFEQKMLHYKAKEYIRTPRYASRMPAAPAPNLKPGPVPPPRTEAWIDTTAWNNGRKVWKMP